MSVRLRVPPGSLAAGSRTVAGDDHHYLFRVRRMRDGDALVLFDGAGVEAEARVESVGERTGILAVAAPRTVAPASGCHLTVAQALIKGERMTWCIQKLVELGAAEIVPVRTARTVVDLRGDRADKRHRRYSAIAVDAARQSRRATVPTVGKISELDDLWPRRAEWDVALLACVGGSERTLEEAVPPGSPGRICVAIGPEGGFTADEIAAARAAGFTAVGLGRHVLRSETAALAVAAWIGFRHGDLGHR